MKIVSYNINGLRASEKLGLIDWLEKFDADIYCFQEVRCDEQTAKELLFNTKQQLSLFDAVKTDKLSRFDAVYNCGDVAGYAGTAILSKCTPDKVLYNMGEFWSDNEGRTTTVIFGNLAIIDAYIPNGNSRLDFKMKYIGALQKYIEFLKENYSVVCVGDYNIAHEEIDITHPKECRNKSVFLPIEREAFTNLLNSGMVDSFRYLNPQTVLYSWRSYRSRWDTSYNSWKYRIDYCLVSDDLKDKLVSADILDLEYSDHLPCVCELKL